MSVACLLCSDTGRIPIMHPDAAGMTLACPACVWEREEREEREEGEMMGQCKHECIKTIARMDGRLAAWCVDCGALGKSGGGQDLRWTRPTHGGEARTVPPSFTCPICHTGIAASAVCVQPHDASAEYSCGECGARWFVALGADAD